MDIVIVASSTDHRESVLKQARGLSAGTMATITGFHKYSEIDPVQADFIDFCEENETKYRIWQEAWKVFADLKGYKSGK